MADKTVNVKIQYNVDTAQVQKAEQLLRQANQASNTFQASAQKAGQGTANAFSQANRSILSMETELARLKTQISVASNPAAVKRLSDQYKDLALRLREATKQAYELPKAINETTKATTSLSSQFGQLYTAAKLFLTAGIIRETVNMTLEMARLAGNVEGVERAFNRAFPNSVAILNNLRTATHGTVDDFQLMQRTLQATNLGVAVEQLPILFEFAATRAQQTGESVDYLVDSIVRGIGRKSILVLDNLGLSATRLREQFNGASLASQSVADVTRGVAAIAKVELEKMGGYAETSATAVDRLTVAVKELRVEASRKAETSGFVQLLTDAANGIRMFIKGNEELVKERAKLLASQEAERVIQSEAFKQFGSDQQKKFDFVQQEINSRQQLIGKYNDEISELRRRESIIRGMMKGEISNAEARKQLFGEQFDLEGKSLNQRRLINDQFAKAFEKEKETLSQSIQGWTNNRLVIQETIKALQQYLAEIQKISTTDADTPGLIEKLEQDIESLGESLKKAKTEEEISKINIQLLHLNIRLRELQDLGKTAINPFASYLYDLRTKGPFEMFGRIDLRTEVKIIEPEKIEQDTEKLTVDLAAKMKAKMGKVGKASADGFIDHFKLAFQGNQEELLTTGIDIFADQLVSFETAELASLQNRLNNLRNFYDEQILLAGDNDAAKERLRLKEEQQSAALQKRIAEQERKARRFSIIIDTAAGIAKAFATSRTIYEGIINAALVAAQGASQLAIVNRTPARFAKGVLNLNGPGTGTSDSIDARLSKGESVMTAQEWKTSSNVLKDVRAKKLDDKVLANLKLSNEGVKYMGMDDKNIVNEIRELKNSFPDVEARGNLLYTTRRKSESYKQWVRKSSLSE